MTIFTCEPEWEAMLTCIYEAWTSRLGQDNIKLEFEPIEQYSLFEEYVSVQADDTKAYKVSDAVNRKISPFFYDELLYASMSYEKDVLDVIFRVMLLGFHYGESALRMVQYRDVMRFCEIRKRVGGEVHHFREFMRFNQVRHDLYVAHFEPKSRIVAAYAPIFSDRMPSENWVIIDDVHREAVVHESNSQCYIRRLTEEEFNNSLYSESVNDEYTDMWKAFFKTIAIEERTNKRCQDNLFPKWKRKHAVEFKEA